MCPTRLFGSAALLGTALALFGCGPATRRPNILIAVFDACRADKIGCYGFDRPTSTTIDQLAADPDSVKFEHYYVQGSWTKPSTASLFTGLFLHQHRVSGASPEGERQQWFSILPPELRTLAEEFHDAGYYTFGVTANPHLDPRFGFDQGFDVFSRLPPVDYKLKQETLRLAEESNKPFLGYVHFNACHYPYAPGTRDEGYMSTYGFEYDEAARVAAGVDFSIPGIRDQINEGRLELEPADVRFLNLLYEARLRGVDQRLVAPLLDGLRDRGLYDDTLIILTADHGEELYDHGGYGHGHALWQEVVHVPLIVKFPKGTRPAALGASWEGLARAVDIFPSLVATAGLERPPGMPGRNIFAGTEVDFALTDGLNRKDDWALVVGDQKVISWPGDPSVPTASERPTTARRLAVFDLIADPGETRDLASERPEVVSAAQLKVRRLWRSLAKPRTSFTDVDIDPLPDEAVETLRSLGYID